MNQQTFLKLRFNYLENLFQHVIHNRVVNLLVLLDRALRDSILLDIRAQSSRRRLRTEDQPEGLLKVGSGRGRPGPWDEAIYLQRVSSTCLLMERGQFGLNLKYYKLYKNV